MRGSDDASNGPKTFAYLPTENNVWRNPESGLDVLRERPMRRNLRREEATII